MCNSVENPNKGGSSKITSSSLGPRKAWTTFCKLENAFFKPHLNLKPHSVSYCCLELSHRSSVVDYQGPGTKAMMSHCLLSEQLCIVGNLKLLYLVIKDAEAYGY